VNEAGPAAERPDERLMRELFKKLSTINKIGLIGALIGFLAGMAVIIIAKPVDGLVITAVSTILVLFCFWFFFGREVRRSKILRRGEEAEATILEVRSTGMTINMVYPQIELLLEVHPRDGEPYQVKTKCLIDQADIPGYQPGNVIAVTIDPKNRKRVAVGARTAQV
jgi:hypothetical protein